MSLRWAVLACALAGLIAADPALARSRHKAKLRCTAQPLEFSWYGFLFNPPPVPNGCSPPVYSYGEFVGQDPDRNIRHQLERDPATGHAYGLY